MVTLTATPEARSPTSSGRNDAECDYRAAFHEIESNLDVRRLMFVLSNILVPALAMAMTDCLTGSAYAPSLRWFPTFIVPIVGGIMALSGAVISCILIRCHFGLVVNGMKMRKVLTGEFKPQGLNWLGVTTNFVALTALSSAAGISLLLVSAERGLLATLGGLAMFLLIMIYLRANHWSANRWCKKHHVDWSRGKVQPALREKHARMSLDATTADVSVIVIMATALFAGTFNAMTNVGGVLEQNLIYPSVEQIKSWGLAGIAAFTLLSLLLSGRMVVRLRIALAEHSQTLAELRDEEDDPWRFRTHERTYLLFMLPHLLSASTAVVLFWSLFGMGWGLVGGTLLLGIGLGYYPYRLGIARRRAKQDREIDQSTAADVVL